MAKAKVVKKPAVPVKGEMPIRDLDGDKVVTSAELIEQLNAEREAIRYTLEGQEAPKDKAHGVMDILGMREKAQRYFEQLTQIMTGSESAEPQDLRGQLLEAPKTIKDAETEGAAIIQQTLTKDAQFLVSRVNRKMLEEHMRQAKIEFTPEKQVRYLEGLSNALAYADSLKGDIKEVRIDSEHTTEIMEMFADGLPAYLKYRRATGR